MSTVQNAPYGTWKSPITADLILSDMVGLVDLRVDGDHLYWTEMRPKEGGRFVLMHRTPDGQESELNPAPFNARTRVHEYGGAAWSVADGVVYFANFADQRLYRQRAGADPVALTPDGPWRYADSVVDRQRGRLIAVREDHSNPDQEAVNSLVGLDLAGGSSGQILVQGYDFFSSPALSPDGSQLAWLCWNHPHMPWDGAELWVGKLDPAGNVVAREMVAGQQGDEALTQPRWAEDGTLYFISDPTGWWNIYRWRGGQVEAVTDRQAEFGLPQWVFGLSTYDFVDAGHLVCAYTEAGQRHLALLDVENRDLTPLDTGPFYAAGQLRVAGRRLYFRGASPTQFDALVELELDSGALQVIRRASNLQIDPGYLSVPQPIEFPTTGGLTAHAYFYPPTNQDFQGLADERPPLVVFSHGGPTGATSSALDLRVQFFTSRGIGVVDVNYGGSTGYGTAYRRRLNGQWGIVDVDDCTNAALYLADAGLADRERLAIRGGSAGGYTTLACLTFRNVFKAGASHFGVSDLEGLAQETHKFESRYLDSMIGPYPQRRDLYVARSPIHHTEQLNCPVIFLQGLEDKVVPPNQAERMVEALRHKGVPVAYLAFAGEQHGFRQAPNIKRAVNAELTFYARIFGFALADAMEPLIIENLD